MSPLMDTTTTGPLHEVDKSLPMVAVKGMKELSQVVIRICIPYLEGQVMRADGGGHVEMVHGQIC